MWFKKYIDRYASVPSHCSPMCVNCTLIYTKQVEFGLWTCRMFENKGYWTSWVKLQNSEQGQKPLNHLGDFFLTFFVHLTGNFFLMVYVDISSSINAILLTNPIIWPQGHTCSILWNKCPRGFLNIDSAGSINVSFLQCQKYVTAREHIFFPMGTTTASLWVFFFSKIELAGSTFPRRSCVKKIFDLLGTYFICCAKHYTLEGRLWSIIQLLTLPDQIFDSDQDLIHGPRAPPTQSHVSPRSLL